MEIYLSTAKVALRKPNQNNNNVWKETLDWPFSSKCFIWKFTLPYAEIKHHWRFSFIHKTFFYICTSPSRCCKHRQHFLLLSASGETLSSSSESPVMMTWQCGRNAHVLPGEWPGRRKTSDRPWRTRALHSVQAAKLRGALVSTGCIWNCSALQRPVKLFHSKIESALWQQTKSPLKTGESLEHYCFLLLGKQKPFSCGRTGSKWVPWL